MSDTITLTHEDQASIITMNAPPMNLMDIEVMDALIRAHEEADNHEGTRVIVLRSGVDGIFSNGLNPQYVVERDQAGRVEVFKKVGELVHKLYAVGKPVIAMCNGPAMAGGAVLAITADFRYFDAERGRICFAESKVGVPVPPGIVACVEAVANPAMVREIIMLGKNMDANAALDAGLSDGNAPGDRLQELVQTQAERLSRLSPDVLRATKQSLRRNVLRETEAMFDHAGGDFEKFVGDDYLGEGLTALLESRKPTFTK